MSAMALALILRVKVDVRLGSLVSCLAINWTAKTKEIGLRCVQW